jgi:hypothetical protein
MAPDSWHTRLEKDLIKEFGGTPHTSYGVDGELADGTPVEVRVSKNDDRFRIGKSVHKELVRKDGAYLFDDVTDNQPARKVSAGEESDLIGRGKWFKDRDWPHKFVDREDIF